MLWPTGAVVLLLLIAPTTGAESCLGPACAEHARLEEGGSCGSTGEGPGSRASYTNATFAVSGAAGRAEVHFVCSNTQRHGPGSDERREAMWTNITLATPGRVDSVRAHSYYGFDVPGCRATVLVDLDPIGPIDPALGAHPDRGNCPPEGVPSITQILP